MNQSNSKEGSSSCPCTRLDSDKNPSMHFTKSVGSHVSTRKSFFFWSSWIMRAAERSCRARGFERSGISWFLERVDIGTENTRDRVMRPTWLQEMYLRRFTTHWSATLLDTKWWPGCRPVPETNVEKLPPESKTPSQRRTWSWCVSVQLRIAASARSSL